MIPVFLHLQVQYYWNDQGCNPMFGCEVTNLRSRDVWGQVDNVMLIDLEINSEFFFRLQVFNSAGRGPKGEWRRGETANYRKYHLPCDTFHLTALVIIKC